MTISNQTSSVAFQGNGTVGPYPCAFKVYDQDHVQVFVDGVLKALTTDYTVSGVGDDAFDVTFTSAVSLSSTISVSRVVPLIQETDYLNNDEFDAETHERALDLLVMMAQQINAGNTGKAVRFPPTDPPSLLAILPAASERASKLLAFDTAGEVVAVEGADLGTFSPGSAHTWTATQTLQAGINGDGWVVADQSGNLRIVLGRSALGDGQLEVYDNDGVLRGVLSPLNDPAFYVEVPAGTDGVSVRNLSSVNVAKLRHAADGHGLLELRDSGGNLGGVQIGNGDPEGVRTAVPGTIYLRTAGGAETALYIKESGVGNTGWQAVRTKGFILGESAEQTITSGTLTEVAHGLGARPRKVWGVLRNKVADAGYAVDDEIETFAYRGVSGDTEEGVLVGADATNTFFTIGSSGIRLWNKNTGQNAGLTNSSWRVVLRWEL